MNKTIVGVAALALLVTGCGDKENTSDASKATPSMLEQAKEMGSKAGESMAESSDMLKNQAQNAAHSAEGTMDAMKDGAQSALDSAKQAAGNVMEEASSTVKEKAEVLAMTIPGTTNTSAPDPDQIAAGKKVYDGNCFACHGTGVAGAPKLNDRDIWQTRLGQGMDVLVEHAIKGYRGAAGYMPPKGGFAALSDDDVAAAVAYMVDSGS